MQYEDITIFTDAASPKRITSAEFDALSDDVNVCARIANISAGIVAHGNVVEGSVAPGRALSSYQSIARLCVRFESGSKWPTKTLVPSSTSAAASGVSCARGTIACIGRSDAMVSGKLVDVDEGPGL